MNSYAWVLEPDESYEVLNNKHDTGYKYLLSVKRVFVQLLKSFVKQSWVNDIDEDNVENINKSFILNDFKGKEADLVYKIKINEQEIFFYVLMELQSTVDFQMPYRLLQYMMEIWRVVLHDTETKHGPLVTKRKEFKLPNIIPCVLYSGARKWTVPLNFKDTLAGIERFDHHALDFQYILIDISSYNQNELLEIGNLISAVFYMDQKHLNKEFYARLKDLLNLIKNLSSSDYDLFITWIKNILTKGMNEKETEVIDTILCEKETEQMIYALEGAFQKAKQEGKAEGELNIAKKLIDSNIMSLEQISTVTGLSIDELKKIKSDIE
ncbi:MAG TPA: hypothetical protein DDZ89_07995 [Clostridiales bacterium]|nr:hypothetical protein [Clostridiales bacterium]